MIAATVALALAVVTWPDRVPLPGTHRRRRRRAARDAVDRAMPQLLGVAVGVLLLAFASGLAAVPIALGGGITASVLLRRARRAPQGDQRPDPALPLVLTVAALLLRSGKPPSAALLQAARCTRSASLAPIEATARCIDLGEPAAHAWAELAKDRRLAAVGRAASRASDSGAALAQAWEATAEQLRHDERITAEITARKTGIRALAPLGLCFLPSFICLGVVPILIGLAGDIL